MPIVSWRKRDVFKLAAVIGLSTFVVPSPSAAQAGWSTTPFTPSGTDVVPFGYGPVAQYLSSGAGQSGNDICQNVSPTFQCISVSGGSQCSSTVPSGTLVSCNPQGTPAVDETAFQPVNCQGQAQGDDGVSGLLGPDDWCLTANYMPARTTDTLYQFNNFVRLGINTRFGGMVSELYGVDKIDRIQQNGGGAVQLSLWAFTPTYAPPSLPRAYFAVSPSATPQQFNSTPYDDLQDCQAESQTGNCSEGVIGPNYLNSPAPYPCSANGQGAGTPINPIQAISTDCNWGESSGRVDDVLSPGPGRLTVTKSGPANFTRSDPLSSLTWAQTSQVIGPAAVLSYDMRNPTTIADTDFQEVPAIFLHQGLGAYVFYYAGAQPYTDSTSAVSEANVQNTGTVALQLPNRNGPFGTGAVASLTEDWVSTCDVSLTKCITIASFSGAAQDVIAAYGKTSSYYGIHGFFSLTDSLDLNVTVFLFPYRFDDVVQGRSVRQWIYAFHNGVGGRY